ncbi:hypothetical protein [Paraclostridium bifermentans]|uniref:hypothetical protein n=1 Tax=Paraclostridium bifermentans TaxID=1490 RepID=UPI001FF108D5|nr:hypothetical protein [Paraclostridium bifermentans]UOW66852.1 hypothetical protein MTR78_09845 [Paraclostridium bifermentans]
MFTIDFTKPWLYKDIIYFNQGNLSTNNTLRCKLVTGGSDDFTAGSIACTFTTKDSVEISGFGKLVDAKNGIIDIVFPSNALVVGTNKLEVLVNRADGGVAQSPPVLYDIWQGLTTGNGVEAETNYPILIELINSTNEASNKANLALNKANSMIADITDAIDNAYRSANEADIATSSANAKIEEVETAKTEMIKKVDTSIVTMKSEVETAKNEMASKADEKITDVNRAIAAGTKDLEVKEARRDMDGVEHDTLKLRLESDLKKGKVIEETKEGTYLSFNDTVGGLVSYLEVLGNTVQDVTNLANIRSSCIPNGDGTFKMSILSVGKNIANDNNFESGAYYSNDGGKTVESKSIMYIDYIKVNSGENIVISLSSGSGTSIQLCHYDKNKVFIKRDTVYHGNKIAIPSDTKYIRYSIYNNTLSEKAQIEYGVNRTQYVPYQETRCDIKLPCQLEKWDRLYFDKEENAWCVEKGNTKYFPDVSKLFNFTDLGTTVRVNHNAGDALIKPSLEEGICNILPYDSNRKWEDDRESCYLLRSGIVTLKFNKSKISNLTIEGVIQYVKDIGLYIHYPTTTPQKIVLPQSEQIKLNSFVNKTHIYTISGDVDVTVKATVSKSLASTVQANTNEINILNGKIADIEGLKETQDFSYELPNGQNYLVCKDTQTGVVKDLKIKGVTKLIDNEGNEVESGTLGATLTSVGNGNEIEVLSVKSDGNLVNYVDFIPNKSIDINTGNLVIDTQLASTEKMNVLVPDKPLYCIIDGAKQGRFFFYTPDGKYLGNRTNGEIPPIGSFYFRVRVPIAEYNKGSVYVGHYDKNISTLFNQDKKPILFKDTDGQWKPVTVLRGVNNICDTIENGTLNVKYAVHIIGENSNIIKRASIGTLDRYDLVLTDKKYKSDNILCDKFKFMIPSLLPTESDNLTFTHNTENKLIFNSSNTPSIEDFKTKYKGTVIVYEISDTKKYEVNPLEVESYNNETMISFGSGVIAPKAEFKMTSSLPNFAKSLQDQVRQLQDQVYKTNVANFTVALNTLDTKLRLDRLEAPKQ